MANLQQLARVVEEERIVDGYLMPPAVSVHQINTPRSVEPWLSLHRIHNVNLDQGLTREQSVERLAAACQTEEEAQLVRQFQEQLIAQGTTFWT